MTTELVFEWDEGNRQKIWRKHCVDSNKAEAIFRDPNYVISRNKYQPDGETRYNCVGRLPDGELYLAVFILRHGRIRIISARRCHRKEGLKLGYQYR